MKKTEKLPTGIRQRGTSFEASIQATINGKKERSSESFKTLDEAIEWRRDMKYQLAKGGSLNTAKVPFKAFYRDWMVMVRKPFIRESTFKANYKPSIKLVEALFGDIQLEKLDDVIVQLRINTYGNTHGHKTTLELLKKIRASIKYAVAKGLIPRDFTPLLTARNIGAAATDRNRKLSISETIKLRNYCFSNLADEFSVMILVALDTGCRRGELLFLAPSAIHDGVVDINGSLSPISSDPRTKGDKYRSIKITPQVFNLLVNMKPHADGRIFEQAGFHQSEKLNRILSSLGMEPSTLHGMRGTSASLVNV